MIAQSMTMEPSPPFIVPTSIEHRLRLALERCGLIVEVGSWALRRAALDHRSLAQAGLHPPRAAVNVSPVQLREHEFVNTVQRAINDGISPPGVELEMTESVLMDDPDGAVATNRAPPALHPPGSQR